MCRRGDLSSLKPYTREEWGGPNRGCHHGRWRKADSLAEAATRPCRSVTGDTAHAFCSLPGLDFRKPAVVSRTPLRPPGNSRRSLPAGQRSMSAPSRLPSIHPASTLTSSTAVPPPAPASRWYVSYHRTSASYLKQGADGRTDTGLPAG